MSSQTYLLLVRFSNDRWLFFFLILFVFFVPLIIVVRVLRR